ncbi:MAG: cbb3-type cytochrome oxidase assembly protein CcoS [Gammaproteobacteria bacterium]|nr:cbb3-type cytochrome oxidase assembly protein CcoS [Gammaproteobacteria bacterium]
MEILYMLIPLGLIVMLIAIIAFLWAIKSGQYEDLDGPAHRILMDDDDPLIPRRKPVDGLKDDSGSDNISPS